MMLGIPKEYVNRLNAFRFTKALLRAFLVVVIVYALIRTTGTAELVTCITERLCMFIFGIAFCFSHATADTTRQLLRDTRV